MTDSDEETNLVSPAENYIHELESVRSEGDINYTIDKAFELAGGFGRY